MIFNLRLLIINLIRFNLYYLVFLSIFILTFHFLFIFDLKFMLFCLFNLILIYICFFCYTILFNILGEVINKFHLKFFLYYYRIRYLFLKLLNITLLMKNFYILSRDFFLFFHFYVLLFFKNYLKFFLNPFFTGHFYFIKCLTFNMSFMVFKFGIYKNVKL